MSAAGWDPQAWEENILSCHSTMNYGEKLGHG